MSRGDYGENTDAATGADRIGQKVECPFLVLPDMQGSAGSRSAQPLSFQTAHGLTFFTVKAVQPHDAHSPTTPSQNSVQSSVAIPRLLARQRHHFSAQLRVAVRFRFIAIGTAIHSKELAGLAFADGKLLLHKLHIVP